MKSLIVSIVATLALLTPQVALGQDDYVLLSPLPGLETTEQLNQSGDPVGTYFTTIYQIGVSIALVIAVVMFIFGGIQYMTSDSIGGKSNGRETITKALIGILLAVGSYLLLFLIGGGESVKMSFDLPESGFVEPVYRNDQVCEVRYTATDAGGFLCLKWWFGGSDRCDWEGLEQCACDKDINSFDCPQGNDGPLTMDVSGEAIYSPGFQGQCIDVNINDPVTPSRKVYQEALTIGSCGAPEGPIEDPNDNEETESASQPVVIAQATDSRIQMSLQAISVSGGRTSLEYSAELLTDVEGGVVLMLELYRADENGEYTELIGDRIPLGDINNQGGSSEETWPILIDTPTPPAVAKLRAYNAGGEQLLSEYLYGFGVEVVHPES